MKSIKLFFITLSLFTISQLRGQCPPNNSLGTILVNSGQPVYCSGSNITGKFQKGNAAWSFVTPVVWSYTGNNSISAGGPNNANYGINGLTAPSGNIQAACTLLVNGAQCPYAGSLPITLSTLQANAGNNQIYIPGTGVLIIGNSSCYTNNYGSATVSWLPTTGIVGSNAVCQPQVNNLSTNTTYVLTVTDSYCTATSQINVVISSESFAVLQKKLDAGYYKVNSGNILYFKYDSEYNSGNLTFKIFNDQNVLICNSCIGLTKNYGDNRYSLLLSSAGVSSAGYYYLEVTNEKKEVHKLKFRL